MKFYIAGRTTHRKEVNEIFAVLQEKGHKITLDWTLHKHIKPYRDNLETAREYAIDDMKAVLDCDVFVLLTSEEVGSGSATELGAAIGLFEKVKNPRVYIIGEHPTVNMFYFHPAVKHKQSIQEVLEELNI